LHGKQEGDYHSGREAGFGRRVLAEWQEEHGAFTLEELASARAEIAAADLEYLQGRQSAGAA
jgi:hypothetical protein